MGQAYDSITRKTWRVLLKPSTRFGAWMMVVVMLLILAIAASPSENSGPDAYTQPVARVYYGPLECFDSDSSTQLVCQRPYVAPTRAPGAGH